MWTMLKWATLSQPSISMPSVCVGVLACSQWPVKSDPNATVSGSRRSVGCRRGSSRRARRPGRSAPATQAPSPAARTASRIATRPTLPTGSGHHQKTCVHPRTRQPPRSTRRGSSLRSVRPGLDNRKDHADRAIENSCAPAEDGEQGEHGDDQAAGGPPRARLQQAVAGAVDAPARTRPPPTPPRGSHLLMAPNQRDEPGPPNTP